MATSIPDDYYPKAVSFSYTDEKYTFVLPDSSHGKLSLNICTLFNRLRGTILRVNSEGNLVAVGWRDWLSYQWNRQEEKEKVRAVIDQCLESLDTFLSQYSDQKVAMAAAKYLFDRSGSRGIGRIDQALYNRSLAYGHNKFSQYLLPEHTVRVKLGDDHYVDFTDPSIDTTAEESMVSIDLGDKTTNENFWKLLTRKSGEKFQVGDEKLSEKETNVLVQRLVTANISKLNAFLEQRQEVTKAHQFAIKQIFSPSSPLYRMNRDVFDRGAIREGSKIEQILNTHLEEKRNALIKVLKEMRDQGNPKNLHAMKRVVETAFMDLVFEEFRFAQKLGSDLERNGDGGSGGARYAFSRFSKQKILVIKPGDEGPHGVNNPRLFARLKRLAVSPKACLEGNSEPKAEWDSWLCDRHFGLWTVPPTDIRYVASTDFVGTSIKECSIQMYVEGCKTLGEYIGISDSFFSLPRPFLRWYCGSQQDTGVFGAFPEWEEMRNNLLKAVPDAALERASLQDMLTGNTDCHLENILVKSALIPDQESIISRIFNSDKNVTDREIEVFVRHLFQRKGNQELLDQLLFSQTVELNNLKTKITLIKHDGGSSNPHSQPSAWDYLSVRFKHLFEILPHFDAPFLDQARELIVGKETILQDFLREKAKQDLHNILGIRDVKEGDKTVKKHVFDIFWANEENHKRFYDYIFEKDETKRFSLNWDLRIHLFEAAGSPLGQEEEYMFYFTYHLQRIYNNVQTRLESYIVLEKHVKNIQESKRTVFKVRSRVDFERELES